MWVPYIYLPAYQYDALGTPLREGARNVASIGISSTVGRVVIGRVAMQVSSLRCLQVCCLLAGAATILLALLPQLPWLIWVFTVTFGLSAGSTIALLAPLLVELFGLRNLPNAFGFLCAVQAPGVLALPAVCGAVHDLFDSYVPVWMLGGGGMVVSSLFLLLIKRDGHS